MATNVGTMLRTALAALESERATMDRQIAALRQAMGASADGVRPTARARKRKPMSAAARRAVSQRMKKYWAKRRAAKAPKKKTDQAPAGSTSSTPRAATRSRSTK